MKINVVGGGPSGLYFALLAKRQFEQSEVSVYEQNLEGATYGFGIVLADRGLERMRKADSQSYEAIMAASFMTRHRVIAHPERSIFVEGGGYGGAIARLKLLDILGAACRAAGVRIHHGVRIESLQELDDADLVVGADGVNSSLRREHQQAFGTTSWHLTNRLAWYGTRKHFPYPLLSFKRYRGGHFVAAAYPYTESMGTFVAECDAQTWTDLGMEQMNDDQRRLLAQEVFAEELTGSELISNKSNWHRLPVVRNAEWFAGHRVLIGDALHSAHPTIGSGTRIAMEDSIALVDALSGLPRSIPAALQEFRRIREPAKAKLVSAAEKSFTWYEEFASKMNGQGAVAFVFDFLTRTGRVDESRLLAEYPEFMRLYASALPASERRALLKPLQPA